MDAFWLYVKSKKLQTLVDIGIKDIKSSAIVHYLPLFKGDSLEFNDLTDNIIKGEMITNIENILYNETMCYNLFHNNITL